MFKYKIVRPFFIVLLSCICFSLLIFSIIIFQNIKNSQHIKVISVDRNESIWIYDKVGIRCMTFDDPLAISNVIFGAMNMSCIYLDSPLVPVFQYYKMILSSLYLKESPKNILMMGHGGGVMASELSYLIPDVHIDIIEINPKTLELSKKYFSFLENDHMKVIIEDANYYVKSILNKSKKYDLIILDVFDHKGVPLHLVHLDLIGNLKLILENNGVIAINDFVTSSSYDLETNLFKNLFDNFYNLVNNNRVIIASNGPLMDIEQLKISAKNWESRFKKLEINSNEMVNYFVRF
jgi:spermidine synthase